MTTIFARRLRVMLATGCCAAGVMLGAPALAQNSTTDMPARAAEPAPTMPEVRIGQTVEGNIAAAETGCRPDPRFRTYRFTAAADSRIEITMQSETFDTVVELGRQDGCEFQSLGANDDGNGPEDGLNSRLRMRIPEAGEYVIRATALNPDGAGDFTLAVNTLPPPAPEPAPIALTMDRRVRGTLTDRDATIGGFGETSGYEIEGSRPYHLYTLTGAAGQTVRLKLDSSEFDPVIEVGAQSPLGFSVVAFNDDGGGPDDGLNSRLNITFRTAGSVVIRVSPLGPDFGRYTLEAETVRGDAQASASTPERTASPAAAAGAAAADAVSVRRNN